MINFNKSSVFVIDIIGMNDYHKNNETGIYIMYSSLLKIDPELLTLASGDGTVAVSNRLQGWVFCELDGELVHRFNSELAANPSADSFNNIGGNSLWPGPEGGDSAFNYLPGSGWLVQPAINSQPTETLEFQISRTVLGKRIVLRNRKGMSLQLDFRRMVMPIDVGTIAHKYNLKGMAYRTLDELQAVNRQTTADALFCAWSLEQFPGGDGVIAFGKTEADASGAINADYYGDPGEKLQCNGHFFRLELGGKDRFQIGVNHHFRPELIGAYDRSRSLLFIRRAWRQDGGLYFNIADNDQPRGPYSAADSYSIFNGGELGFFELETIAPLALDAAGRGISSRLESETIILKGEPERLAACLEQHFKISPSIIEA